jgi:hypothetical protein
MSDPRVREGIRLIRAQEWFESHEVLEGPWREAEGETKSFLHALIHAAVSLEHLKRGNPRGSWGQWTKALQKFAQIPASVEGWDMANWQQELSKFYTSIELKERSRRHVARESMAGLPSIPTIDTWPNLSPMDGQVR